MSKQTGLTVNPDLKVATAFRRATRRPLQRPPRRPRLLPRRRPSRNARSSVRPTARRTRPHTVRPPQWSRAHSVNENEEIRTHRWHDRSLTLKKWQTHKCPDSVLTQKKCSAIQGWVCNVDLTLFVGYSLLLPC